MAKDDIDLDGINLDDFNFDVPEFQAEEESGDSRKPVTRAVKGAVRGVKQEFTSPNAVRKALTLALPEGYGLAADTLENIATDTRSLYDRITGESPELVSGSKKFGRRAMGLIGDKVLPKKLANKINNSLEEIERSSVKSDADYRKEQEDGDLAALAEIFKARVEADGEKEKQEAVEKVENKALEQARFKSSIQALTAINRSMSRLVGYQDKITVKYQQKMLELNYRQAATTKQLLDAFTVSSQKHEAILENIRKNTALPEAVKIRGSEMFGQLARQKLMGNGLNTISNWAQNYTKQVMDNVSGLVQGIVSPMAMMGGMGGEDIDKVGMGGEVVGSMIGGEIRDRAAMAISPLLAKNKHIARGSEKLRGIFSGLPQKINEWANTREEGTGYKAAGMQLLKDFLPKFILDSKAGGDSVDRLDEVASFDKIARRSLIEIIPGYLSEIAHWSRIAVTGEKDSEKKVYNLVRGGFTTEKEQLRDVSRQIMPRQERESLRLATDEFLKEIGGDVMSPKAQRVLKRKLLDELANGRDLVPSRLVQREQYPGEDYAVVDEVVSLIADTFNLDPETGKRLDDSTDALNRTNNITDQFRRMSSMIPAVGDRVRILSDVLGKDSMRKLGYIERDKDGREDRVNFNKFWEAILDNEDESAGSSGTEKGKPTPADRVRGLADRLMGAGKIDSVLAGDAARADDLSAAAQAPASRLGGLERYLGNKSTLVTILRESREFHAQTVDLLQQLTNCGCGGGRGDGTLNTASARMSEYFQKMKGKASSAVESGKSYTKNTLLPKFEELKKTGKDIWIQGEDHPVLQEWKLKAGEYRDKATGEILTRWEDIRGDVEEIKTKAVVRYNDLVSTGVFADAKGRVKGKVGKFLDKFKGSQAGAWTAGMIAGGKGHITTLGNKVNEMRGTGTLGEFADNLGSEMYKAGNLAKDKVTAEGRKFKPRIKRLMSFFTGNKAGADITSELTGDQEQDMLTLAIRSVQLQYETLKQVTTEKVRKGSMQDIWSRRKELADKAKDAVKGKYADTKGMMAKGGMLQSLLDKFGMGDEEGGDDGDTYIDMGDGDGNDRDRRRRNGRRGRTPNAKPRGKIGRAWDWTKRLANKGLDKMGNFGKAVRLGARATSGLAKGAWWATKMLGKGAWGATKFAGRMLGSQAVRTGAMWLGRMALGAVAGAAGLVSAPVLAAVGVVTGIVAIGSLIYGAMKDKLPLLARLRMIQYGVEPDPESKQVLALAEMEKLAGKHVKVSEDGKAELDLAGIPVEQLTKIFGVELEEGSDPKENEHFMRMTKFLYGRFREVYLTHVSNMYVLTKSTDIGQVDAKVVGQAAVKFVNGVSMKGKENIFDEMDAPFADEDELEYDAGDVEDEYDDIKDDVKEAAEKEGKDAPKSASQQHADALKAGAAAGIASTAASNTVTSQQRGAAAGASGNTQGGSGGGGGAGTMPTASGDKSTLGKVVAATTAAAGAGAVTASVTRAELSPFWTMGSGVVDDGMAVRYRTYGLTELLANYVYKLETLEQALYPKVSYDKDKQAKIDDIPAAYLIAEAILSPVGDAEVEKTYVWFHRRFLPTFLTYCSAVRMRANIDAKDAGTKLDPAQLLDVLKETSNARDNAGISVWDITESPFRGYVLNDDMNSVKEPLYQLQQKIKDKVLQDPKVANAGKIRGKNGELEDVDPNQVNRPATDGSKPGILSNIGSSIADAASGAWDTVKGWFGSDDKKTPQQGAISSNGQSVTPQTAVGQTTFPVGTPINHPGGGTGGNINDIPQPKGDGWENSRDTLMAAANMVGVDPALAASVAGVESSFNPNARPWSKKEQRYLSSAASYYQVIDDTWDELMGKYAAKYGIAPGTRQTDPRANALLGLEYIRENMDKIKDSVGSRGVTDTDVYLAHFLGPGGAKRFLSANPADPAVNHVGADQASSNPSIFWDSRGRPRTVADVYRDFDKKLTKWRMPDAAQVASAMKGGTQSQPATDQTASTEVAAANAANPELVGKVDTVSLVKGQGTATPPPSTNTVNDAPVTSTPVETATETADARQTQNTTATMSMAAATADSQTAAQAVRQADNFGGADKSLNRLIGVNEAQLEQLVALVSLMQSGKAASEAAGAAQAASNSGKGAVNDQVTVPKPAAKSTVSVGRG